MSAIIQASPLEKLSQEPLPTGDSCVLVIFEASGDLTKRKLIPGLYNISCEGCMNPEFEVLGIARTPMSSEEFRKKTGEAAAKSKDTRDYSESGWTGFETRLHYMEGNINNPNFYPQLRNPGVDLVPEIAGDPDPIVTFRSVQQLRKPSRR